MQTKKLELIRRGFNGISMTVCPDKITLRIETYMDDSELAKLKLFAELVAQKVGAKKIAFARTVERTREGFQLAN